METIPRKSTDCKPDRLLRLPQVVSRCGVSMRTFYNLLDRRLFGPEVIKFGRSAVVRERELEAWFAHGCPARDKWTAVDPEGGHR